MDTVVDDDEKIRLGLRGLSYGLPMKIENQTYKLFKPGESIKLPNEEIITDEYFLGVEVEVESKNKKEKAYLGVGIDFTSMLSLLTKLDDDIGVYVAGSIAINDTYNGKINDRPKKSDSKEHSI